MHESLIVFSKKTDSKGYVLYDCIYDKLDKIKLQKGKTDQLLPVVRLVGKGGLQRDGRKGMYGGDVSILYLDCGSGYTIICLSKFTELYKKNVDFAVFKLKNKKQQKE